MTRWAPWIMFAFGLLIVSVALTSCKPRSDTERMCTNFAVQGSSLNSDQLKFFEENCMEKDISND